MIITKDKSLIAPGVTDLGSLTLNGEPLTEDAVYILDDNTELAQKARSYFPDLEFVTDTKGALTDIIAVEHMASAEELREKYEALAVLKIREQYSPTDENKVIREALATGDYSEFDIYNDYVEQCKAGARLEVYGELPNNQTT